MKKIDDAFFILMKFGEKENLEKLRKGQVYMKNLKYYIEREKQDDDECIGDKYEGKIFVKNITFTMYNIETGEFIANGHAPKASIDLGLQNYPVFCMFMLDYRNHTDCILEGEQLRVTYTLTEEQRTKMSNFGEYVLIVKNNYEFIQRINAALKKLEMNYYMDKVNYHESNKIEQYKEIYKNNYRVAFWKRNTYSYQQEYRLIIENEVDDFMSFEIGDISDITELMTVEKLFSTYFEANFIVELKDNN